MLLRRLKSDGNYKKNMSKWSYIILIAVIILVVGGLIFSVLYKDSYELNKLITINGKVAMTADQQKLFDDLKVKLADNADDYSSLFKLARLKQDVLDWDGAIEMYWNLRKVKPDDILPLINLGSIYFDSQQYVKAEEVQKTIIKNTPKWVNAYRELASIYRYHLKDKAPELEPMLIDALKQYPELETEMTSLLAYYYDEIVSNKDKAIEYYTKLLKLRPDEAVRQRLAELKNS